MEELKTLEESQKYFGDFLKENKIQKLLWVCGNSWKNQKLCQILEETAKEQNVSIFYFSDFKPNPTYDSVLAGLGCYRENGCNAIAAAGGGSALDVAKCIKLFSTMDEEMEARKEGSYLKQKSAENHVPFLTIPTTAGTGSEATRYAIIYYKGEKQSVTEDLLLPSHVILCPDVLEGLSDYQRKATMLDVLCHAVESYWAVSADETSQNYAAEAMKLLVENKDGYLENTREGNEGMLEAANLAGKAINISRTTVPHAMCYKITSLFGASHGHAAALCLPVVWEYMLDHMEQVSSPKGRVYVQKNFQELARCLGCEDPRQGVQWMKDLLKELKMEVPAIKEEQMELLVSSVNPARLKNNPVAFDREDLKKLYENVGNL